MPTLTIENLRETCDALASIFDPGRFTEIRNSFQPQRTKGLAEFHMHRSKAHPLAVLWHNLESEIQKSERVGSFQLSDKSLILIDTLMRIKTTAVGAEIEQIIQHMEKSNQFFSGLFEGHIFASYKQNGADITAVPENAKFGVRTPEFIARCADEKVFIECKSLEDNSRQEGRLWEQTESQITKSLQRYKKCWHISVVASRRLVGDDMDVIVRTVRDRIERGLVGKIRTKDGAFEISCSEIAAPDTWYDGALNYKRKERGWIEVESRKQQGGPQQYRNPTIIESFPYLENDEFNRISTAISTAHKQLPRGHPGIVHIEIPYRDGARLLDIMDPIFQRTFGYISNRERINAIVLSGRVVDHNVKQGGDPVIEYRVIIPNPEPACLLPEQFVILGSKDDGNLSIEDNQQGTIVFEFGIHEPMSRQLGRSIFHYCDKHGQRQVRLWQSFKNHFRADIVDVSFGRRTFKADLNDLAVNVGHKLAIAWSAETPRMAVDGELLTPCENGARK